jgi:hypothetical protein
MPVLETVLIYGVIPLVAFLVLAALTLLPGGRKDRTKYRPGQPWDHEPVWYEPHPDIPGLPIHGDRHDAHGAVGAHGAEVGHTGPRALTSGAEVGHTGSRALTAGVGATAAALALGEHPHGSEVDAPRRSAAGGARGTW